MIGGCDPMTDNSISPDRHAGSPALSHVDCMHRGVLGLMVGAVLATSCGLALYWLSIWVAKLIAGALELLSWHVGAGWFQTAIGEEFVAVILTFAVTIGSFIACICILYRRAKVASAAQALKSSDAATVRDSAGGEKVAGAAQSPIAGDVAAVGDNTGEPRLTGKVDMEAFKKAFSWFRTPMTFIGWMFLYAFTIQIIFTDFPQKYYDSMMSGIFLFSVSLGIDNAHPIWAGAEMTGQLLKLLVFVPAIYLYCDMEIKRRTQKS